MSWATFLFIIMGTSLRSGPFRKSHDNMRLIITTIMGMVFGYFVGVSFPSVSFSKVRRDHDMLDALWGCLSTIWTIVLLLLTLWNIFQITLPSSLISSFDLAFNDDRHASATRSFPENLGSGSTPIAPKVVIFLVNVDWILHVALL